TDLWTPTSLTQQTPTGRALHTAVWRGTEMIVWGGGGRGSDTGARDDPVADTWARLETGGVPSGRAYASATFTGWQTIVWGGAMEEWRLTNDGGRYDLASDAWDDMAPSPLS